MRNSVVFAICVCLLSLPAVARAQVSVQPPGSTVASGPAITDLTYKVIQENNNYLLVVSWLSDSPANTATIGGEITTAATATTAASTTSITPVTKHTVDPASTRFEQRFLLGPGGDIPDNVQKLTVTVAVKNAADATTQRAVEVPVPLVKQIVELLRRPDPATLPPAPNLNAVVSHRTDTSIRLSVLATDSDVTIQVFATPPAGSSAAGGQSPRVQLTKGVGGEVLITDLTPSTPYNVVVKEVSQTYGTRAPEQKPYTISTLAPLARPKVFLYSVKATPRVGGNVRLSYRTTDAANVLATIEQQDASGNWTRTPTSPLSIPANNSASFKPFDIPAGVAEDGTYRVRLVAQPTDADLSASSPAETQPFRGIRDKLFNDISLDLSNDLQLVPEGLTNDAVRLTGKLILPRATVDATCDNRKCTFPVTDVVAKLNTLPATPGAPPTATAVTLQITAAATDDSGRTDTASLRFVTPAAAINPNAGMFDPSTKIANSIKTVGQTVKTQGVHISPQVKGVANLILSIISGLM